jgi:hypothetical protein
MIATSTLNWSVTVSGEGFVAPLACGSARTVDVAVDMLAGMLEGTQGTLVLTATFRLDPTVVESMHVDIIIAFDVYLPLVVRQRD